MFMALPQPLVSILKISANLGDLRLQAPALSSASFACSHVILSRDSPPLQISKTSHTEHSGSYQKQQRSPEPNCLGLKSSSNIHKLPDFGQVINCSVPHLLICKMGTLTASTRCSKCYVDVHSYHY